MILNGYVIFSAHDNYYSFASDDFPLLEQEPARGLWIHICK